MNGYTMNIEIREYIAFWRKSYYLSLPTGRTLIVGVIRELIVVFYQYMVKINITLMKAIYAE